MNLLSPRRLLPALLLSHLLSSSNPAHAISVGDTETDTSPEAELASFTVQGGFAVNLFASEKDGVVNPISMRWDELGRLWVLTSPSYPQPEPGQKVDDKILILEDTDKDGKSDKTTVFADGLRMPMGLELAPGPTGAAYVGEGEKLWLMRDTNGDGRADEKKVVFSGFGTGDTHQSINSLTWTPDGALMFSQGLHCASNVTTAWGGRKLYGAGFWVYRPLSGRLTPYPTGFPLNAWGTVYDDNGQPFTVAGAAGMFWTTPLLVSTEHLIEGRALPNNGQIVKQGMLKYCGIDIPKNAHWPADMHGELVSGGFFENCIYRHKLQDDKDNPSGYEAVRQPDLMKSSSVAFRPVDVKFGPEGALYISDWYNPIIGHYQASFRHPARDKTHGRIWRVVQKDRPLAPRQDLTKASAAELLKVMLKNDDRWASYQAQRLLMGKSIDEVVTTIKSKASVETQAEPAKHRLEMLRQDVAAMFETFDDTGLKALAGSNNPALRGDAARLAAQGAPQLKEPLAALANLAKDANPRVRLDAVVACGNIERPESMVVALQALDLPQDSFIDRALELAVHALAPQWKPAFLAGQLKLPVNHLAWLLEKEGSTETLASVRTMLIENKGTFDAEASRALMTLLAKRGNETDLALVLKQAEGDEALLQTLVEIAASQNKKAPANAVEVVGRLVEMRALNAVKCAAGVRLAGIWHLGPFVAKVTDIARDKDANVIERTAAVFTLGVWKKEPALLASIASGTDEVIDVRLEAISALAASDATQAATLATGFMPEAKDEALMLKMLAPFLVKPAYTKALVTVLGNTPCSKEAADLATRALIGIGRNEPELTNTLNRILGRVASTMAFDPQWVSGLANDATVSGDTKRGKEVFNRVTLNCIACHQIGGAGGIIGPQLDAVGRGVPVELLVEAVMWPQRQIKEGYTATTVTTKDGRTMMGYKTSESEAELGLRDMAIGTITNLPKSQIASRTDAGSLMPEGLTASLSRDELRDMIAYLASLGK